MSFKNIFFFVSSSVKAFSWSGSRITIDPKPNPKHLGCEIELDPSPLYGMDMSLEGGKKPEDPEEDDVEMGGGGVVQ